MRTAQARRWALALAIAGATAIAGCGGNDDDGGSSGGSPASGGKAKQGGSITAGFTAQPDYLDPALAYSTAGREAVWISYTPLLTYKHETGAAGGEVIPGLATGLPKVTDGGKTYTLTLRKGLKYSDGSPVKAADAEHAIKRVLNLGSGGAPFFEGIVGATKYEKGKDPDADIEGITTNEKTGEVRFELEQPRGDFAYIIAFPFAALVPSSTPFEDRSSKPPPGVGPYRITDVVPNRQFVLERNRGFNLPGIPKGNLDTITGKIIPSQRQQAQQVLSNRLDSMDDTPPTDLLPQVRAQARDRYKTQPALSTYYFFLNTREKPFDNAKARAAVNYAIDKRAIVRLFGGIFKPGCSFIPEGMPGHPTDPCPYGDPTKAPNTQRAKELVQESGTAGQSITVWGNTKEPSKQVAEYYADLLTSIGWKAKPKLVDNAVYLQTIGSQKTRAQTGMSNWFGDYTHPANFMQLLNGASIEQTNNKNTSNVDDPELNRRIDALTRNPDLKATESQWAEADRYATGPERAFTAPFGQSEATQFMSERMDFSCATFHTLFQNDFTSWCLK